MLFVKNKEKTFVRSLRGIQTLIVNSMILFLMIKTKRKYTEILWKIFSFELLFEVTGIVISGFDLKSHYPSFFEIELYYNDNGKIIYEIIDSVINTEKPILNLLVV